MRNAEIADALTELATLYELDGAVRYRVLAYREAARVVRQSPVSVEELARAGRATELPGVGKTLEEKILALLDSGEIPAAAKLKRKFPPSLVEVTRVPGVGAKTARRLYDELGVSSLEELRAAAVEQRIRELKGLGPKAEEKVLAALDKLTDGAPAERLLLSQVLPVAEQLANDLRAHPASDAVEVAGSARRRTETCHDIDLIATASEPAALGRALLDHPLAATKGSSGEGGARITTHNGIAVDLRIVPPAAYGNLLQHFTGSAEHNIELRERAVRMELSVSEHGITDTRTGEVSHYATEAEVYERLGLAYIEPELREANGEIAAAAAGTLPELVAMEDIRGDLHCHTTISDGHNTLEEMAEAARARGYAYLAVTDHSASHGFGNHVTPERLWERIQEVQEFNSPRRRFRLLAGSEVNILLDGSLDYEDDLLAELDWVIASVHTSFKISRAGDDRAGDRSHRASAGGLRRAPQRAPDREARSLRPRRRASGRGRRPHRDDARDQRQPESARPLRAPRAARRRGRCLDLRQHRCPPGGDPQQHGLRHRNRPASVADPGAGRKHAPLGRVRSGLRKRAASVRASSQPASQTAEHR